MRKHAVSKMLHDPEAVAALEEYRAPDGSTIKGTFTTIGAKLKELFISDAESDTNKSSPDKIKKRAESLITKLKDANDDYHRDVAYVPIKGMVQYLGKDGKICKSSRDIGRALLDLNEFLQWRNSHLTKITKEIADNLTRYLTSGENHTVEEVQAIFDRSTSTFKRFNEWQFIGDWYVESVPVKIRGVTITIPTITNSRYQYPSDPITNHMKPLTKSASIDLVELVSKGNEELLDSYFENGASFEHAIASVKESASTLESKITELDDEDTAKKLFTAAYIALMDRFFMDYFTISNRAAKTYVAVLRIVEASMRRWHEGWDG